MCITLVLSVSSAAYGLHISRVLLECSRGAHTIGWQHGPVDRVAEGQAVVAQQGAHDFVSLFPRLARCSVFRCWTASGTNLSDMADPGMVA